jgi:hypothetical protein
MARLDLAGRSLASLSDQLRGTGDVRTINSWFMGADCFKLVVAKGSFNFQGGLPINIREKSGLYPQTIAKVRFSTFNYKTG